MVYNNVTIISKEEQILYWINEAKKERETYVKTLKSRLDNYKALMAKDLKNDEMLSHQMSQQLKAIEQLNVCVENYNGRIRNLQNKMFRLCKSKTVA